ncbi:MAG: FtsQ-type POTRA domain-containing protein [Patescibacteria group bacterium]|jgi:hypothetical protein
MFDKLHWRYQPKRVSPYRDNTKQVIKKGLRPFWIVVFIIIAGIVYLLFGTRFFYINKINVQGTRYLEKQQIVDKVNALLQHRRWFIIPESNIFFTPVAQIQSDLTDIRLERISVTRSFPSTLNIQITEKQASAFWSSGNRWYELDKNGFIMSEVVKPSDNSVKITFANSLEPAEIGKQVIDPKLLEEALAIKANLPDLPVTALDVFVIDPANPYTISFRNKQGALIYFTTELSLQTQLQKLTIFNNDKNRTEAGWQDKIHYIDLRYGTTKVYYQ